MSAKVSLTPTFLQSVRRLARKYRKVASDLEPVIAAVALRPTLAGVIPGSGDIRKARARSTDMGRGKSGGFRILYVWDEPADTVRFLLCYAKTERDDVTQAELSELLAEAAAAMAVGEGASEPAGGTASADGPPMGPPADMPGRAPNGPK